TNSNFEIVWNILLSRYDNKRRLITTHLTSLFNLPTCTYETSNNLRNIRDQTNKAIQALSNLGCATEHWSDLLVFLVAQKLDKSSRKAWELKLGDAVEYPSYHELDSFLAARIRALDALAPATQTEKSPPNSKKRTLASHIASAAPFSCTLCKENHLLYQCPTFLKQTPSQRFEFIKTQKRCSNCFGVKHSVKDCKSTRACKRCSKRHHTLLHFDASAPHVESEQPSTTTPASSENSTHITSHLISKTVAPKSQILLATALIRVYSPHNRFITVRALLDQGSVSTFITESLAQRLRLSRMNRSVFITGISEMQSVARHAAQITITPASSEGPAYTTTALILRSLTKYMPSRVRSDYNWKHLTGLQLADRDLMSSEPIDVIIGADLVGMLVLEGVRQGNENKPTAQNTTLGWILSGPTASVQTDESKGFHLAHHGVVLESLDRDLRRFWEIDEVPQLEIRSPEEHQCEEHFRTTHSRTPEGRYVVRLPFKNGPPISLGESRQNAITSLHRLDRRLCRDPRKASEYSDFLAEYETLGHMTKSSLSEIANQEQAYYIPHHAVLCDSSATTRLRVVFNASCRTSNGLSLNDHMLIGPKLQKDLAAILLQWRQYRYVFIVDIAKMYRQILIDPRDTDYQRIVWRPHATLITEYRLLTVTYGTAAAPYLALRVLNQLIEDEGAELPLAAYVLGHQTYVDDCVFGADDPTLARQKRDQLVELLRRGGFHLRKWASNVNDLIADLDPTDHGLATHKFLQNNESLKVLGIIWNPKLDIFQFRVTLPASTDKTKRAIMSTIAKFFDPLGWATPVIIIAKIFMQKLWALQCEWDEEIPRQHLKEWSDYHELLSHLNDLSIPRWTTSVSNARHIALHGFSDTSTSAFAASPSRWETFVANRVSTVQYLLPGVPWHHVPTQNNPADCASRGLNPNVFKKHDLWWKGPPWLQNPPESWPESRHSIPSDVTLEQRSDPPVLSLLASPSWDLETRYSSWPKLLRVTAYLYRFITRLRAPNKTKPHINTLLPEEIQKAKSHWLKRMQSDKFPKEIAALSKQRPLPKGSALSSLNPYYDEEGLLRIRGRLRRSSLPGTAKNPIVLRAHPLVALLIRHHHLRMMHAGSQLSLTSLRAEFWILRSRATVRFVLYKCIQCTRERAEKPVELMGDLPAERVNRAARAFAHTGVDYAGPINVRVKSGRGHRSQKAYIALFVCLTTKALHVELVSDYTSSAFIAAYQRFVSRRGQPNSMYSDNGTTFHGANRELFDAHARAIRDPNFRNHLATDKTEWHTPRSTALWRFMGGRR
ncbi:PREDICTED: uncharacterized protein LOC108772023, partial [Cyphomyrmex costatus]|uniref:uncharacterized protein LOC108772023 n=1 Tax=Cyphomyrmex costatus TaxID=456900 RepID=UPI0008523EFA